MNEYKNKCSINIRDLILTFGDEHPQYDRQDWRSNGCPMDYWKWVSAQIRESSDISGRDDSSVPLKSENRIKQEKLFFLKWTLKGMESR